ncbi:MFS transporter [Helicobacter cappadocius]|uniref:MFS transporter n=1 Tax=Helicobacter cappadocius TaxID=3063998 RepID=A0AA90PIJ5_9HELI|nr:MULTISPECIES: MFS transporter [unclassified Helicobacter]MDO7252363.1 MFS transporter [Helicobacter sp. faydin-H75]MDP2538230.1 MFS transporter [Helicobacter sp. faydin-H76]
MKFDSSNKAILALALSSFCMGVTEFIVAGILPDIANHFNITQPQAGWLVTLYAVGVVIGAPLLTIPLSSLNRKNQLLINLGIFAIANLIIGISDSFYLSLFARLIAGFMHGVFFVIATIAAVKVAKEGKQSQAIAVMVSGLTIALVTGVPLGTFVGQAFGFKAVFLLIFILTSIAFSAVFLIMPNHLQSSQTNIKNLYLALKVPPLLKCYFITICTCGAGFVLYTYVADLLLNVSGFEKKSIGIILLLYGICAVIGNLVGGKITDSKGAIMALRIILFGQVIVYSLVSLSAYSQIFVIINLCLMGFFGFAGISPLKTLAMISAQKYTPSFMDSSISLNEGAFNVGIALASFIGGIIFAHLGIILNPIFAGLFALPAFLITLKSSRTI